MATWKKIIVSGSDAHLNSVTASNSLSVGTNQIITTTQAGTQLTGSFTGSFVGDGTGLIGVTATPTFPTTVKTDLASGDKFFVNDDAGNGTVGNKQITYGNLLTDLAGTNLAVESTDSLTLASSISGITSFQATAITGSSLTGSFTGSFSGNASGITTFPATISGVTSFQATSITGSSLTGSFTGSFKGDGSGITTFPTTISGVTSLQATSITGSSITGSFTGSFSGNGTNLTLKSGIISGSSLSSNSQGTVTSSINGVNQNVDLGLKSTDSPTFNGLTLSGDLAVNGNDITTTTAGAFNIVTSTATTINVGTVGAGILNFGNAQSTSSFNGDVIVKGDLIVQGDVTEIQVANLNVEDQFIFLGSGSNGNVDTGIVVQSGSTAGIGEALFWDAPYQRWAVAHQVASTAVSAIPAGYVAITQEGAGDPSVGPTNPIFGASAKGEIYIRDNGEIWIYS